jgi:hypothetical protein
MAGESDQVLHAADEPIIDENKSASGGESDTSASSSSNTIVKKVANKITPPECLIIGRNQRSPNTIVLLITPPAGWAVG